MPCIRRQRDYFAFMFLETKEGYEPNFLSMGTEEVVFGGERAGSVAGGASQCPFQPPGVGLPVAQLGGGDGAGERDRSPGEGARGGRP